MVILFGLNDVICVNSMDMYVVDKKNLYFVCVDGPFQYRIIRNLNN